MEFEHVTFDLPHGTFHALQPGAMSSWIPGMSGKPLPLQGRSAGSKERPA
jgi:hypothetical protein